MDPFDLTAAKLEAAKAAVIADLYRSIFAVDGPVRPTTWRDRLRRGWLRVRGYCSTLWMALRGDDPYDSW